jgi:preprotein translocase subunit YajC
VTIIAASGTSGSGLGGLLLPLLLLVALYFVLIRPQRARARQMAAVQGSLQPGRRVITTAGMHGTVVAVEDGTVVLEIAPGVDVRFAQQAVMRVLDGPAGTEGEPGSTAAEEGGPVPGAEGAGDGTDGGEPPRSQPGPA